jgi:hypothetical protein
MRIVNVRCGSDIRDKLHEGGVPGEFVEFSDPICQGPVPDVDEPEFTRVRAQFIAAAYGGSVEEIDTRLRADLAALEAAVEADRIVLWFEHDIYDQSILIRVLDACARRTVIPEKLHLICIGRHASVDRFIGLGQLTATQLADLLPHAQPVTRGQIAAAQRAWAALRQDEPTALAGIAREGSAELPLLTPALRRWLKELPWTRDGLGLTERLAIEAIRTGANTPSTAFAAVQHADPQPYLGDVMFRWILKGFADAPVPAITDFEDWTDTLALTPTGQALRDGKADWIALNSIDRWLGGTHLSPLAGVWRWDDLNNTIVRDR